MVGIRCDANVTMMMRMMMREERDDEQTNHKLNPKHQKQGEEVGRKREGTSDPRGSRDEIFPCFFSSCLLDARSVESTGHEAREYKNSHSVCVKSISQTKIKKNTQEKTCRESFEPQQQRQQARVFFCSPFIFGMKCISYSIVLPTSFSRVFERAGRDGGEEGNTNSLVLSERRLLDGRDAATAGAG